MKRCVVGIPILVVALATLALGEDENTRGKHSTLPNFVVIFADDQGYQDLGCFGSPNIRTPNIDQMATEGMRLTSFYAQTVCGPSRAALMTGCYPLRCARDDDGMAPHPRLSSTEVTIAEVLQPLGYATGMFGKWDLAGHTQTKFSPQLLPSRQGFDTTFITPSSNDRTVNLVRNGELVEQKVDMSMLTRRYTDEAIKFIEKNRDQPFFVYVAHTMPHTKLAVSAQFKGKSPGGFYGDVIEEIDHNVGRVMERLKGLNIDNNTYVIFTSDNGPWWIKKDHGGHALPLRGAKTSTWEGGLRVPCVIRAPGKIPAGSSSDQVIATIDLLPTLAKIAGAKAPLDRVIDGLDISEILHGNQDTLKRPYFYYQHKALRAVRLGKWKLHLAHTQLDRTAEGKKWLQHIAPDDRGYFDKNVLYDLENDIGETTDVASEHPAVVAELLKHLDFIRKDLGDNTGRGENARPIGRGG